MRAFRSSRCRFGFKLLPRRVGQSTGRVDRTQRAARLTASHTTVSIVSGSHTYLSTYLKDEASRANFPPASQCQCQWSLDYCISPSLSHSLIHSLLSFFFLSIPALARRSRSRSPTRMRSYLSSFSFFCENNEKKFSRRRKATTGAQDSTGTNGWLHGLSEEFTCIFSGDISRWCRVSTVTAQPAGAVFVFLNCNDVDSGQ